MTVDGKAVELAIGLLIEGGPTKLSIATSDGCNSVVWSEALWSDDGTLSGIGSPIRSKKACPGRPTDDRIARTLSSQVNASRVHSDLLLDGTHKLRFRLATPRWFEPATSATLEGTWTGSSLNGQPLPVIHALHFGSAASVQTGNVECAGLQVERYSIDSQALMTAKVSPVQIPACSAVVDQRITDLVLGGSVVEIRGRVLRVRSSELTAEFSRAVPAPQTTSSLPLPLTTASFPDRPAAPATEASVAGNWKVMSINGMPVPSKLRMSFLPIRGNDGCNNFWSYKSSIEADGTVAAGRLVVQKKYCPALGYAWDSRVRSVFRELPIAEHVGDELIIRSPATAGTDGVWLALTRG